MIARPRLVSLVGAAGFACGLVLATLLASADFEREQGLWIGLTLVIGWGWVGAGTFAALRRPDNRVGTLMVATGFAFYVMVGERTDVAALFTAGIALESLFAATAVHLLLAFPSGRLRGGLDRALVAAAYVAVTIGGLVPTMFIDPAAVGCHDCPANLLLIEHDLSFAERWFDGLAVVGIAILLATLVLIARRWLRASPPLRRAVTLVFVAGGALMMLLAALLGASLADTSHTVIDVGWYSALVPFGLLPYLFIGSLIRAKMLRGGAVGSLVATIGDTPGPGDLRDALATALGDPSLELAYWLPSSEQYVDAQGRKVVPRARSGRAVHRVELDGVQVAAIVHDATLLDDPELVEAAGGAAALALERERLEAELRAKVEELSASRARMIRFGMAERRRIERDLHDGAQQRLVSLALDLRLARETVRTDPDRADELLGAAADELTEALEELRELARGIHPALLSDRGLAPAIEALARRAPLPVEVDSRLNGGIPEAAELAGYFVVSEALTNVFKYARASRATVTIEERPGEEAARGSLLVAVTDDGVGGASVDGGTGLRGLADRIASLGGRFEVDSPAGRGTTVRARIPLD
ncbi:MAG TPA: sensor histidine kinase [Solirubrobacterales bacterium]|nr:sensor histidine kinase [Solirubrobacterales bacterium]